MKSNNIMKLDNYFEYVAQPNKECITADNVNNYVIGYVNYNGYFYTFLNGLSLTEKLRHMHEKYISPLILYDEIEYVRLAQHPKLRREDNSTECVIHSAVCFAGSTCFLSTNLDPLLNRLKEFQDALARETNIMSQKLGTVPYNFVAERHTSNITEPYCSWYGNCLFMHHISKGYNFDALASKTLDEIEQRFPDKWLNERFQSTYGNKTCDPITVTCVESSKCTVLPFSVIESQTDSLVKYISDKFDVQEMYNESESLKPFVDEIYKRKANSCLPIRLFADNLGHINVRAEGYHQNLTLFLNSFSYFLKNHESKTFLSLISSSPTDHLSLDENARIITLDFKNKLLNDNMTKDIKEKLNNGIYVVGINTMILRKADFNSIYWVKPFGFKFNEFHSQTLCKQVINRKSVVIHEAGEYEELIGCHSQGADSFTETSLKASNNTFSFASISILGIGLGVCGLVIYFALFSSKIQLSRRNNQPNAT